MRLLKAIILSIILFTSCGEDKIPKQKMSKIIAEIYITDRYINSNYELVRAMDSSFLYEPIFKKYGYSTKEFMNTINYYVERPAKLKTIYLSARQILEDEMAVASAELQRERYRDSIVAIVEKIVMPGDANKITDSQTRSLRWIYLPDRMPKWDSPLTDTLLTGYDAPISPVWWLNNTKIIQKPFQDYEKNSSPVSLPDKLQSDTKGLRMLE